MWVLELKLRVVKNICNNDTRRFSGFDTNSSNQFKK